jgi:ribosomal protein S21
MKKTTHDTTESVDKQHYKKPYLVRKIQEAEADKEVKDYIDREQSRRSVLPPMEDGEAE